MDASSHTYPYHQTRYASTHPYPAAVDPQNYPNHRHHNNYPQQPPQQLQPPQLPTPPPPLSSSYHTLPPPPPPSHQYNLNQPQLPTFHSHHDFPTSSSRLSHRLPADDERPRLHRLSQYEAQYLEKKPEPWEKPRLYVDYDRELHKPQYRLESEGSGSARLRAEYNEQLLRDHRRGDVDDDDYHDRRRARVEPNSDSKYRDLGFLSNQKSSNFDSDSGGYDSQYDELLRNGGRRESRDEVYEDNRRRVYHDRHDRHDRQASRELYDPFEVDNSVGGRSVSGQRDYYGSESGRDCSNVRRKQIQKKSALLRLEMAKPNLRNHSGYYDNCGYYHREKEYYEYSGRQMDEEDRARSPLQLDVSFKSNSLVAKTVEDRNMRENPVSDREFAKSQHPEDRNMRGNPVSGREFAKSQHPEDKKNMRGNPVSDREFAKSQHPEDRNMRENPNPVSGREFAKSQHPEDRNMRGNPVSDREFAKSQHPEDGNMRGNPVSDKEFAKSQHPKLNAGGARLRSSIVVVNKTSDAEKDARHLEEKVTASGKSRHLEEKVSSSGNTRNLKEKVSSSGNTRRLEEKVTSSGKSDINSQPCSNVICDSFGKNEKERATKGNVLQRDGKNVGSGQTPSLKVVKKKKVVKKLVKKVINRHPQPKDKINEPGAAASIICSPSAAFGTDKGETSSYSDACPANLHDLSVNSKVDGSSLNMLSDEHGTGAISADANSCSKNTGNSSTSNLGSSTHEEIDIVQGPLTADPYIQALLKKTSHCSNNVTDSLRVASCPEIGGHVDVSKQVCQGGDSLSLDKLIQKESLETMLSVEGNANSGFLNSEKVKKLHEDITNANGSGHGTKTPLNMDRGMKVSHHEIKGNQIGAVEEIPKGISSVESSRAVGLLCSGETLAVSSKYDTGSDKVTTNCDENIIASNGRNTELIQKKPISFKIRAPKKFPNFAKLGGVSKSSADEVKKKRKATTPLDSSRVSKSSAEPINVSTINENSVDTTVSSSLKNTSHAEVSVYGVQKLDIGSKPGNQGVSVRHGDRSVDGFCEPKLSGRSDANCDPDETSARYIKKRKVSASHPVSTTSADKSTAYIEAPLTSNGEPTQQEHEFAVSSTGVLCAISNLMPSQEGSTVFFKDSLAAVSSDVAAEVRDAFTNDGMKFEHQGTPSIYEQSGVLDTPFDQKEAGTRVMVMDIECVRKESFDVCVSDEQVVIHSETAPCRVFSEVQPPELGNTSCKDMETDFGSMRDELPFVSDCVLVCANGNEVSTIDSNEERMESVPDTLSTMGSPETSTAVPDIHMLDCSPSVAKISVDKGCGDDQQLDLKSVVEGVSDASAQNLFSDCSRSNLTSESETEGSQLIMGSTVAFPLKDIKGTSQVPKFVSADSWLKNQLGQAAHRIFPGRSYSAFTTSNNSASSTQGTNPRTWHRNGSSSVSLLRASVPLSSTILPQRQLPQRHGKFQSNSYVRKGNSLVRQPVPVAAQPPNSHGVSSLGYRANSSGVDGLKKNAGTDGRVDVKNPLSLMRTGGMNAPSDRPAPPLQNGAKLSTGAAISLGVRIFSPLAEPLLSGETKLDLVSSENNNPKRFVSESLATSEARENYSGLLNDTEIQTEVHDENLEALTTKKIVYVKRKLNQLVATSNSCDLPVQNADKIQHSSSDSYYKRRKNQLIRTSLEGHTNQAVVMHENSLNSQVQRAPQVVPNKTYSKKRLHKAFAKTRKIGKHSLVWTALGTQPSNNGDHQKVLPHLFPWKRSRYGRNFVQSQDSSFKYSSASTISKKLLLSRRRDTVYTRSTHGFALKMYKVLSVGGSSLKWSKSIENRSKKANEEATRAVAAVEKKKREQNGAVCSRTGFKFRNNSPGKRIFRIGSVRYKMDPSRRTLKRISDDLSSSSAIVGTERDAKRSYVPKRLVIGNDEYVRIGNGNQLVRNPKKRTRILASERVRWSLHTARLRLAKKRKYCQFFTRFGKCNKDDGKCPFIHDPSKIAVCTKFLKGLCSNSNCKLTHKVLPERMPDCSYFLQGLCSNESCPYRHVHVNPKASTCEGFLKGYCADGNECRKKHSYVCPSFEAMGTCPQGPKCKLHHPKNRTKGKKRKRSREQKNAWGRYFVSKDIDTSEPRSVSGKYCAQNGNDILVDGRAPDFIGIDVSDEEAGESNDTESEQAALYDNDSDTSELELDDLDELIKPMLLLRKSLKTNIT